MRPKHIWLKCCPLLQGVHAFQEHAGVPTPSLHHTSCSTRRSGAWLRAGLAVVVSDPCHGLSPSEQQCLRLLGQSHRLHKRSLSTLNASPILAEQAGPRPLTAQPDIPWERESSHIPLPSSLGVSPGTVSFKQQRFKRTAAEPLRLNAFHPCEEECGLFFGGEPSSMPHGFSKGAV